MLQFDAAGRPAFLHRTMRKLAWRPTSSSSSLAANRQQGWPAELLTAPLPYGWVDYYLSAQASGPTVGLPPGTYAVPAESLEIVHIPNFAAPEGADSIGTNSGEVCGYC
jgi:hypothetical protein